MKSRFVVIACCLLFSSAFKAQEDKPKRYVKAGILCGDISLAPGYLVNENISTVSIPLCGEYYIDSHISLKSDIYLHVSSGITSDSLSLKANHQLFTGLSYHFTTASYFDPYVAFQPGVAYGQVKNESKIPFNAQSNDGIIEFNPVLVPVVAMSVGFRYFFPRYFHIFVEMRYVHGTLLYNAPGSFPIDELKTQFGLGWNLRTKK